MAPSASNILEQFRLGENNTGRTHAPDMSTSSVSAPTTPTVPLYNYTTPRRSGMRTISARDFVGTSQPAAPPPNVPDTDDEAFAVSVPSPISTRPSFNTQGRHRLMIQYSQVRDLQAYVEDSDSDNESTLKELRVSGLSPHVTTGGPKEEFEGEPKDDVKAQGKDEAENKLAR